MTPALSLGSTAALSYQFNAAQISRERDINERKLDFQIEFRFHDTTYQ
jgi:hypothetical protein